MFGRFLKDQGYFKIFKTMEESLYNNHIDVKWNQLRVEADILGSKVKR